LTVLLETSGNDSRIESQGRLGIARRPVVVVIAGAGENGSIVGRSGCIVGHGGGVSHSGTGSCSAGISCSAVVCGGAISLVAAVAMFTPVEVEEVPADGSSTKCFAGEQRDEKDKRREGGRELHCVGLYVEKKN